MLREVVVIDGEEGGKTGKVDDERKKRESGKEKDHKRSNREPSPITATAFQEHCDTLLQDCLREARQKIERLETLAGSMRHRILHNATRQHCHSFLPLSAAQGIEQESNKERREEKQALGSGSVGIFTGMGSSGSLLSSSYSQCSMTPSRPLAPYKGTGTPSSVKDWCVEDILQRCKFLQSRRSALVKQLHELAKALLEAKQRRPSDATFKARQGGGPGIPPLTTSYSPRVGGTVEEGKDAARQKEWERREKQQRRDKRNAMLALVQQALGTPLAPLFPSPPPRSTTGVSTQGCSVDANVCGSVPGSKEEEEEASRKRMGHIPIPPSCLQDHPAAFFSYAASSRSGPPTTAMVSQLPFSKDMVVVEDDDEKEQQEHQKKEARKGYDMAGHYQEEGEYLSFRSSFPISSPSLQTEGTAGEERTGEEDEWEDELHFASLYLAQYVLGYCKEEEAVANVVLPLSPSQKTFQRFYQKAIVQHQWHRQASFTAAASSSPLHGEDEGMKRALQLLWKMMQEEAPRRAVGSTALPSSTTTRLTPAASSSSSAEPAILYLVSSSDEEEVEEDKREAPQGEHSAAASLSSSSSMESCGVPCVVLPLVESLWHYVCDAPWLMEEGSTPAREKDVQEKKTSSALTGMRWNTSSVSSPSDGFQGNVEDTRSLAEAQNNVLERMRRMREVHRVPLGFAIPPHVLLGAYYVVPAGVLPKAGSTTFVGAGISSSPSTSSVSTAAAATHIIAALCRSGTPQGGSAGNGRTASIFSGLTDFVSSYGIKEESIGEVERGDRPQGTSLSSSASSSSSSSHLAALFATSPEIKAFRESTLVQAILQTVERRWTFTNDGPCEKAKERAAATSFVSPPPTSTGIPFPPMPSHASRDTTATKTSIPWTSHRVPSSHVPPIIDEGVCEEHAERSLDSFSFPPLHLPAAHWALPWRAQKKRSQGVAALASHTLTATHGTEAEHSATAMTSSSAFRVSNGEEEGEISAEEEREQIESFLQGLSVRLVIEVSTRVLLYQEALRRISEEETQILLGTPHQRAYLLNMDPMTPSPSTPSTSTAASTSVSVVEHRATPRPGMWLEGTAQGLDTGKPFAPTVFVPFLVLTLPEISNVFYCLAYAFSACLQSDATWCPPASCAFPSPPPSLEFVVSFSPPCAGTEAAPALLHPSLPAGLHGEEKLRRVPHSHSCLTAGARILRALAYCASPLLQALRLWLYLWTYAFSCFSTDGNSATLLPTTTTGESCPPPPQDMATSSPRLPVSVSISQYWWHHFVIPAIRRRATASAELLRPYPSWCDNLSFQDASCFSLSLSSSSHSPLPSTRLPYCTPSVTSEEKREICPEQHNTPCSPSHLLLRICENRFVRRLQQEVEALILSREP